MMNDEENIENEKYDLWNDSALPSDEALNQDLSSLIVKKSQRRTVFIDFLFLIVIGFKEIIKGLLPNKSS